MSRSEREFPTHPDMVGRLRRVGAAILADNAVVVGDVVLGRDVSVWFGVTIRGDDAGIEIGSATNVQDGTVVHVDVGIDQRIGTGVTIGHGVVVHCAEIGDYCLIGMNATLLAGARIGRCCIVGAGSVVAEGVVIPERSVVLGVPGTVRRRVTDAEVEAMHWRARHYVTRAESYLLPTDT